MKDTLAGNIGTNLPNSGNDDTGSLGVGGNAVGGKLSDWVVKFGIWEDKGIWIDTDTWNDT